MKNFSGFRRPSNEELRLVMFNWAADGKKRTVDGLGRGWVRKPIRHIKDYDGKGLPMKLAKKLYDDLNHYFNKK